MQSRKRCSRSKYSIARKWYRQQRKNVSNPSPSPISTPHSLLSLKQFGRRQCYSCTVIFHLRVISFLSQSGIDFNPQNHFCSHENEFAWCVRGLFILLSVSRGIALVHLYHAVSNCDSCILCLLYFHCFPSLHLPSPRSLILLHPVCSIPLISPLSILRNPTPSCPRDLHRDPDLGNFR